MKQPGGSPRGPTPIQTTRPTSEASREVADGIRTRDRRHHKPELYQLSYCHRAGANLPGQGGAHFAAEQLDGVEVAVEEVLGHQAA